MSRWLSRLFESGPAQPARIVGRGLLLRAPRDEDYPAWARLRAESRAFLAPWEPLWNGDDLSERAWRRRIAGYRREIASDEGYPFFIFDAAEATLLGGVHRTPLRRRAASCATLGYWMGAPHAGKGTMKRAVDLLCGHAFGSLGLERIEAACLPENAASIRVLEANGFQREGYARAYLAIQGVRRDHLLFARLASDRVAFPADGG